MQLGDADLTERVKTRESLGSRVDVVADLADQELIVDLFHQLLARRHRRSGHLERAMHGPGLRQSPAHGTDCN